VRGPEKELITYSRMATWRSCRRRHHYAYVLFIRPVKQAIQLLVGTVLHAWLEVWWGAQELETPPRWIPHTVPPGDDDDHFTVRPVPEMQLEADFEKVEADDPFEAARLRAMVLAYHLRWRGQKLKVLSVEREFTAPLENPIDGQVSELYQRGGKIDVIAEYGKDAGPEWEGQWVFEHKSNKGPLDPEHVYFRRLVADAQCSDYLVGARANGYMPRGIVYDVVCKPAIEPYKATPPEDRKLTIGMGCKECGGGKGEKGDGRFRIKTGKGKAAIVSIYDGHCDECKGTGWKDAPHYYANVRLNDETPGEYGLRCFELMITEPHRYLHRHKVVRTENEITEHLVDGWYDAKSMDEQVATGVASRNPDACYKWNRPCDYLSICWGGGSLDDARLFRISKKHPELRVVSE